MPHAILLLDPDADQLAPLLGEAVDELEVTACTSLSAASAHLVGTPFEAVVASVQVEDGLAVSLLELDRAVTVPPLLVRADTRRQREDAEGAGATLAFVAQPDARVLGAVAAWHLGISGAPAETSGVSEPDELRETVRTIAEEMGRVTHAVNNPISVILGNAQLVRELFRAAPGDPMIGESLTDIETASRELVALMEDVQALRRQAEEAAAGR